MKLAALMIAGFACASAFASELGQPLDCTDWVIHEPGISCITLAPYTPYPCGECGRPWGTNIDNNGNGLFIRATTIGYCSTIGDLYRHDLVRATVGGEETIVASLSDRCADGVADYLSALNIGFDALQGRVIAVVANNSTGSYAYGNQRIALVGFATMFDVLQSFAPPASVGIRVPYMPEGMRAADHFDTYWGDLSKPLDFSQAHPLLCDYPATPPHVGDYLSVPDTVPTPAPGHAVYYLTSATYQGQTRDGRKTTNGHLSGRDASLLPACTPKP